MDGGGGEGGGGMTNVPRLHVAMIQIWMEDCTVDRILVKKTEKKLHTPTNGKVNGMKDR